MNKRIILLIVLVMILSIFSACSTDTEVLDSSKTSTTTQKNSEATATESTEDDNLLSDGITYKTGMPIVKEPITLHAIMESSSHCGDYNDMAFMDKIESLTNINIEFEYYIDDAATKINLIFASRSFPDITFRGVEADRIQEAAKGGDIIPLNDLIDEYAPNIQAVFEKFPYAEKIATSIDGNIYSLPYINDSTQEKGIRDLFLINKVWLENLDLEVPTTIDEFYEVLKAFKDNAGNGIIPENVIPYHSMFETFSRSSLDIFPIFGVYVYKNDYLVATDDGVVMYQAMNPAIKEPLEFMHKLYSEGLIVDEMFTDDTSTYNSRVASDPPMVGVFPRFTNGNENYIAMAPPSVPGNDGPYWRNQNNMVAPNYMTIYAVNEYPEATIRFADVIAEPEWSIQGMFGMLGSGLEINENGKYVQVQMDDKTKTIPGNFIPLMLTRDINDQIYWDPETTRGERLNAINTIYKSYVAPLEWSYPPVVKTDDEREIISTYFADIQTYREQIFSHWIVDGGIEEEWDAYVAELEKMRIDEVLEAYQSAFDRFYGLNP